MADEIKTCALTGSSGWVGGSLKRFLTQCGWGVVDWTRRPAAGAKSVSFRLGEAVDPSQFTGTQALVHCAYDFSARNWDDITRINVRGTEKLFCAARAAGVERIVFISSASAFTGCRSLYGRAKLEIEAMALSLGAIVIRPGLVYGNSAGGVFGGLVKQARQSRFIPLLGGGNQLQYLIHDEDLGRFVARCLAGEIQVDQPILLAHEKGRTLRQLLTELAATHRNKVTFVPVPWRMVWLGLKMLETLHLPAPFRSDSLIGLIYQNPAPSFELAKSLQAECRPFQPESVSQA